MSKMPIIADYLNCKKPKRKSRNKVKFKKNEKVAMLLLDSIEYWIEMILILTVDHVILVIILSINLQNFRSLYFKLIIFSVT